MELFHGLRGLRSGKNGSRESSELLHKAECVHLVPVFYYAATGDAVHADVELVEPGTLAPRGSMKTRLVAR